MISLLSNKTQVRLCSGDTMLYSNWDTLEVYATHLVDCVRSGARLHSQPCTILFLNLLLPQN